MRGGAGAAGAMTTHALILPMRIERLTTWCGRAPTDVAADHIATAPEAVTCERCMQSMRSGLRELAEWVPRLASEEDR